MEVPGTGEQGCAEVDLKPDHRGPVDVHLQGEAESIGSRVAHAPPECKVHAPLKCEETIVILLHLLLLLLFYQSVNDVLLLLALLLIIFFSYASLLSVISEASCILQPGSQPYHRISPEPQMSVLETAH